MGTAAPGPDPSPPRGGGPEPESLPDLGRPTAARPEGNGAAALGMQVSAVGRIWPDDTDANLTRGTRRYPTGHRAIALRRSFRMSALLFHMIAGAPQPVAPF